MSQEVEFILKARLIAQGLNRPIRDEADYPELFMHLQPVSPIAMTYPGNPPALVKRTRFDSGEASDDLRGDRKLVKARFLGGTVGYVLVEHLEDYAVVFRKQPTRLTPTEREVLGAIRELGPITPRLLKEETGILAKKVGPALAKLQRAFLVFEDQTETNWERGWSTFSSAFPNLDLDSTDRDEAARRVLNTFFKANIFATMDQIRSWSELPIRDLKAWVERLRELGDIETASVEGLGDGWITTEFKINKAPLKSVHMLHQQDGLVRAHRSELKRRFADREVLQYLLIDGQFAGADTRQISAAGLSESVNLTEFDLAVVMSHHLASDRNYLRQLAQTDIAYIGLLGPKNRRERLLSELGEDAQRLQGRLHGPAGLDIGGSGPAPIALSIVAQMQKHLRRHNLLS